MSNLKRGRGRPKLPRPEGMTEIEFRRERQRGYQRKYIERLAEKLKSREEAQEYWEGREYFRTMGLGKVIRELEEEVMRETGDFIFE